MITNMIKEGSYVIYTGGLFPKYTNKLFKVGRVTDDSIHLIDKDDPYKLEDGTIDYLRFMVHPDHVRLVEGTIKKKRRV